PTMRTNARSSSPRATWNATSSEAGWTSCGANSRRLQPLPRRPHALEQVSHLPHALEDDVHRERRRVELLVHLVPAKRGRNGSARARPHGVDGGDRLALAVLVGVDEDAASLRLRPLRRREPAMRTC